MNLEPAPRLPKLPFLVGDAVLLTAAATLAIFSPRPLDTTSVVIVAVLVVLGAALGVLPFILGYAADSAEALERERARASDQINRLHGATESLARAAAHIKAVEEAVHKSAREAETLPYRMQEKLAEFNEALASKEETDREALESEVEELRAAHGEQLKQAAEKVVKATAELAALEATTRKQLAAAEAALAKVQTVSADAAAKLDTQLTTSLRQLDTKLAEFKAAVAAIKFPEPPAAPLVPPAIAPATPAAPSEAPAAQPASAQPELLAAEPEVPHLNGTSVAELQPAAAPAPEAIETVAPAAPAPSEPAVEGTAPSAQVEPPKPKKPRAPRKPKPEETMLAMSESAAPESAPSASSAPIEEPPGAAPVEEERIEPIALAPSDASEATSATATESSSSSDGATRLLATAYIGIGNKLFIRGDGPGLSWDHGVPMQFVSIGKWGWSTHEASGPIRCKLYKNDDIAALTGDIVLESGRHTEVTALF